MTRWPPNLRVLVCPVNSIHYHNDPVVCSAGEARSGSGDDRGRREWHKCHGKHSCCHILLWSHRETCRDLSLVNKKAEEERERRERKERKRHTQRMLKGWETLGQMNSDLKPWVTLKEQRKGRGCVFVLGGAYTHLCIHKCLSVCMSVTGRYFMVRTSRNIMVIVF